MLVGQLHVSYMYRDTLVSNGVTDIGVHVVEDMSSASGMYTSLSVTAGESMHTPIDSVPLYRCKFSKQPTTFESLSC